MNIECEVSLGEMIDKISILKIKMLNIKDTEKIKHVQNEENILMKKLNSLNLEGIQYHLEQMIEVNSKLWKIEDDIRDKERAKKFDQEFIELARAVYVSNDERFKRKHTINQIYQSNIVEVKSYQKY
jgi:hypothetical protein